MDHVVVDVEIQRTIEELPNGWDDTHLMGVACACVWEHQGRRMRVYGPDDLEALRRRLLSADRVTGYNIYNFDYPVIWGFSKPAWRDLDPSGGASVKAVLRHRTNDLLRRIWVANGLDPDNFAGKTHGNSSLDNVAGATLGRSKIGHGADAPKWFQAGQWARVANYCADDVALERDLAEFVDRYGYVLRRRDGQDGVEKVHLK